MTGNDAIRAIHQHRIVEAVLADGAGDQGHLGVRMRPGVAGVGNQRVQRF